jgi:zinc transport system permease protein
MPSGLDVIFSGYFAYGLIGGLIIALIGGFLGVFLVLKKYSLLADAISHIALLGAAVAFILQINNVWLNVFAVVLLSLLIEFVRKNGRFQSDSVIAIFITASLAVAITVFAISKKGMASIEGYLFGSLATVGASDFFAICVVCFGSLAIFTIFFKKFKLLLFDEEFAKVCGLNTNFLNYLLIGTVSAFIAVSIKAVGVLMVSAVLVIPALTALSFRMTFLKTVIVSSIVALFGAIFGILLSVLFVLPIGTSIVLALTASFILAVLLSQKQ